MVTSGGLVATKMWPESRQTLEVMPAEPDKSSVGEEKGIKDAAWVSSDDEGREDLGVRCGGGESRTPPWATFTLRYPSHQQVQMNQRCTDELRFKRETEVWAYKL